MAGRNCLGSLDCFFPGLDHLAFCGLDVDHLLDGYVRNRDFAFFLAAFGLFVALRLFFAAIRLGFAFCLLFAALRLGFAFCLLLAAFLLFAFAFAAAFLLQGNDNLGRFYQFGADNLFAFYHVCLGANGFGIDGLRIFDNYCCYLVGAGNDCSYFLLASATGGGEHCCTNCANKQGFFHNKMILKWLV